MSGARRPPRRGLQDRPRQADDRRATSPSRRARSRSALDVAAKAKLGPVGIKGAIGFDALVYRRAATPTSSLDFRVTVEVTLQGPHAGSVKVTGTLEGPGPVARRRQGHVLDPVVGHHEVLIDETWGRAPQLGVVTTDVSALLAAELAEARRTGRRSCRRARGDGHARAATGASSRRSPTRSGASSSASASCRSGSTLRRFGSGRGRRAATASRSTRGQRSAARGSTQPVPVREHFARAQFVEMSEEEKPDASLVRGARRRRRVQHRRVPRPGGRARRRHRLRAHGVPRRRPARAATVRAATRPAARRDRPRAARRARRAGRRRPRPACAGRSGWRPRRGGADRRLAPRRSRRPTASRSPPIPAFALDGPGARRRDARRASCSTARHVQLVEAFELAGS